MKTLDSFAVFILTHGRADNVVTRKTLKNCGYTGRIIYVVDNEDKQAQKYIENFGEENVVIFDKKAMADCVDEGNNFDERRTITHARNACFQIAKDRGIKYFVQLDDDYTGFGYKIDKGPNQTGATKSVRSIDPIFAGMICFLEKSQANAVAFAQGGDFIGGINNGTGAYRFSKRKCMNSFFCSTDRPFKFVGSMNEDVNTYTTLGSRGELFFTVPNFNLTQKQTQSQQGGLSDMYLRFGTYCKSFTTTMMMPSAVRVNMMKSSKPRLHHTIKWNNTVPVIIREEHKKKP